MNKHIRTKEAMEEVKDRFKNPDDTLQLGIAFKNKNLTAFSH